MAQFPTEFPLPIRVTVDLIGSLKIEASPMPPKEETAVDQLAKKMNLVLPMTITPGPDIADLREALQELEQWAAKWGRVIKGVSVEHGDE